MEEKSPMKRVLTALVIIAVLVPLMSAAACAQNEVSDHFYSKLKATYTSAVSSDYVYLVFDQPGTFAVNYDGSASLSYTGKGTATLTGAGSSSDIWQYYYTTAANPSQNATKIGSDWTLIGSLISPLSTPSDGSAYDEVDGLLLPNGVTGVALGYDVKLASPNKSNTQASGDADLTASAVPEPGTVLAALSILGPAGLVFRRKKMA